mmetsp:Transcript_19227/g.49208  ORF Transcript_19227/g.49208 Transcript_19227/m.49208 type:complete len:89 (-) Transcript_19227:369-635(-)
MHAGFIGSLMMISFLVIRTWIGCQNRARVRMVDNIPEDTCAGCEDCCCAFWCGCCTDIQLLRHTGVGPGQYLLTSAKGTMPGVAPVYP